MNISKATGQFFITWVFLLTAMSGNLWAQEESAEKYRFDISAVAFKNDSTIEATEDGWSEWIESPGKAFLDFEENEIILLTENGKEEYYFYDGEYNEPDLEMKAVDENGDDCSIRLTSREDHSELYLFYSNFALVYYINQ